MRRVDVSAFGGPLYAVFRNPVARVLDRARIVGNMEQTVSMLRDQTKLDYKTVQGALDRLIDLGLVQKTRKMGNAQAYRFNVENDLHLLLDWATEFQHGNRRRR